MTGTALDRLRRLGSDPARPLVLAAVPPLVVALTLGALEAAAHRTPAPAEVWFLIDVSRSMMARDVGASRLERARQQLASFAARPGPAVGVIAFAGDAELILPPSPAGPLVGRFLESLDERSAPGGGSKPDSAFARLAGALEAAPAAARRDRIVVLLSDGEFTSLDAEIAAAGSRLSSLGVRLVLVGLGDAERGGLIPALAPGAPIRQDESRTTKLDVARLQRLSTDVGAELLAVGTRPFDLAALLEPRIRLTARDHGPLRWPTAVALILASGLLLASLRHAAGRHPRTNALAQAPRRAASATVIPLAFVLAGVGCAPRVPAPVEPSPQAAARKALEAGDPARALAALVSATDWEESNRRAVIRLEVHARVALAESASRDDAIRELERALAALRSLAAADADPRSGAESEATPEPYPPGDVRHDLGVVKRLLARRLDRVADERRTERAPRPDDRAAPGGDEEGEGQPTDRRAASEGSRRRSERAATVEQAASGTPLEDPGELSAADAIRRLQEASTRAKAARAATRALAPPPRGPDDR